MNGTKYDAITYSLSLINDEGVVYGVVGIDITLDYLSKIFPSTELLDDENSCYMIALNQNGELSMEGFAVSGSACKKNTSKVNLSKLDNDYYVCSEGRKLYTSRQRLNIYNDNTPYGNQQWMLVGITDTESLFAFTGKIKSILLNDEINAASLTLERFKKAFDPYKQYIVSSDYSQKQYLFQIPDKNNVIYVNLRLLEKGKIYTGIIEDVTNTVIEKQVIEYERDYDTLTGLANQILSDKKVKELEEKYAEYLGNVVLEVTEGECVDENHQNQKAKLMKKWHAELALDDYGSGYNSEKMLLSISPKFIKIDMDIIRNIDSNPDKCKIVENIVGYAHEREMKVIAEGIETIEELKQVVRLRVDYLQGYLFSKPQYLPPKIRDNIVKLIQVVNEEV